VVLLGCQIKPTNGRKGPPQDASSLPFKLTLLLAGHVQTSPTVNQHIGLQYIYYRCKYLRSAFASRFFDSMQLFSRHYARLGRMVSQMCHDCLLDGLTRFGPQIQMAAERVKSLRGRSLVAVAAQSTQRPKPEGAAR
jgi:hypothetical protein